MLRVEITSAKPGMRLALPVQNAESPDNTLLNVGYKLTDTIIERLQELGVRSVWVQYPGMDFLERYLTPDMVQNQGAVVQQITNAFTAVQGESSPKLNFGQYTSAVGDMVRTLIENPKAAVYIRELAECSDDDAVRHASAVTLMSLLMGLKLEGYLVKERKHIDPMRAKRVTNLGIGAMLHDIGLTQLSKETIQDFHETGHEDEDYREHTTLGYHMVRGQVEPSAASVILQHHQRYDGTGYTGRDYPVTEGGRIHIFPRIVGLADTFDRMRQPVGMPEQPAVFVLQSLLNESLSGKFDPEIMRALFAVVPPYAPGTFVTLSNGRDAMAIEHHLTDPCHPTVQLLPDGTTRENLPEDGLPPGELLDLHALDCDLDITHCEGQDVTAFNFDPPEIMQADNLFHLYV